ncbi:MAG: acyl-phosphate glycerol 3-phosphate acyltransferase [Desulfuromonadales bacterium GWD2_61_12]|nr:MAG: acyl-phosphate glycerol 3-phosphate acyltransferase [Desulfuromonadales bacterium GWC2_61_20]OGR35035.1 MAG: acyl-phosphate glycerol 3-phosphate acyltransferase [Desulfuromonadales bacterium GWD2_61_12]
MSLTFLLLAAYLIGAIPTGVLLTRLAGAGDIRQAGSGNIGATNVYRVAGRGLGIATLVGDALKGIVPLLVARALQLPPEQTALIAAAAFLGHLYPVYLGFKGGKGVATALGIFLVLSPATVALAALLFGLLLWKWRYVSLGSICAAAAAPPLVYFFTSSLPLLLASLFVAVMVIVRHRENIKRLLAGSENRFKA